MDSRGESFNENFYRELAHFEFVKRLVRSYRLVITNKGKVAAQNVRVEIILPKQQGIAIVDDSDIPDAPRKTRSHFEAVQMKIKHFRPVIRHAGAISVDASNDCFRLEVECGTLQPGRQLWTEAFNVAISKSGAVSVLTQSFADNLSEPRTVELTIAANIAATKITVDDLFSLSEKIGDEDASEDCDSSDYSDE